MFSPTPHRSPFVSQRGGGRAIALIALGAVALVAGGLLAFLPPSESEIQSRSTGPAPVLVEPVRVERVQDQLEALGTANANETVTLASKVTDRLESIYFEDGQVVEAGTLLFKLRDDEQQAELSEAQALLAERERQLARVRSVGDSGAVSQAALDEQLTRYDAARAQEQLVQSRIQDRRIVAPFSGVLGLRRVSPGELVVPGTELITLSDISPLKVDFTAPERYIGRLQPGQRIEARSIAFPDTLFEGVIQSVSPIVDPISRAAQARAIIPNEDHRLRPGMLLRIQLSMGEREALTIPESALAPVGNRQFVLIVDEDSVAHRREVQIGARRGGRVEVVGGLAGGERVVAHGYRAAPGQKVDITEESEVFTQQEATGY